MQDLRFSITSFSTLTLAAAALLGLVACGDDDSSTPPPPPVTPELDSQDIAAIEATADRAVAAGIPGVVVLVRAGDQTVRIARGVSDLASAAPMQVDSRFRMASMAKSFTASVVLQLVHEGKLQLGDTLGKWLPGMLPASEGVTIEQLLRQESGLFDYAADERHLAPYLEGNYDYYWSPEALIALAADHPPVFTPGERFMYCNTNYTALALIIEKATGRKLADEVRDRITTPLGLHATSLPTDGALAAPYARGYMVGMGDPLDVTGISGSYVYGAGNLVSTAEDVATFYGALAAGQVVSPGQLDAMFLRDPSVPQTSYGMGVFRFDDFYPCGDFIGHDGGIPGYYTVAYSRVDGKRQFAVLVNSFTADEHAGDAAAQAAFTDVVMAAACQ